MTPTKLRFTFRGAQSIKSAEIGTQRSLTTNNQSTSQARSATTAALPTQVDFSLEAYQHNGNLPRSACDDKPRYRCEHQNSR